jgi:hypothetical protein
MNNKSYKYCIDNVTANTDKVRHTALLENLQTILL